MNNIKITDIKKLLINKNNTYNALQIVEKLPINTRYRLIEELMWVYIFSNVTNSHLAKQLILGMDYKKYKNDIISSYKNFLSKKELDNYVIKDIAQLLYELRFKEELLLFIKEHYNALLETSWIESDEDIIEIENI